MTDIGRHVSAPPKDINMTSPYKVLQIRVRHLPNNTRMTNRTDINLIYQHSIISQRFDFEFINRCDFHFWWRTSANHAAIYVTLVFDATN